MSELKPKTNQDTKSAGKVLAVLDVLCRNFYHGYSPSELCKETGFAPSDITRYVSTLETAGFAERIQETGRIRPSHRFAQKCVQIMNALNAAKSSVDSSLDRITRG